jgi:hypothetical protein
MLLTYEPIPVIRFCGISEFERVWQINDFSNSGIGSRSCDRSRNLIFGYKRSQFYRSIATEIVKSFPIQSIKSLTRMGKQIDSRCQYSRSALSYIDRSCQAYLLLTLPASKTAKADIDDCR